MRTFFSAKYRVFRAGRALACRWFSSAKYRVFRAGCCAGGAYFRRHRPSIENFRAGCCAGAACLNRQVSKTSGRDSSGRDAWVVAVSSFPAEYGDFRAGRLHGACALLSRPGIETSGRDASMVPVFSSRGQVRKLPGGTLPGGTRACYRCLISAGGRASERSFLVLFRGCVEGVGEWTGNDLVRVRGLFGAGRS